MKKMNQLPQEELKMSTLVEERKLSPVKRKTIAHLLLDPCIERACKSTGVTRAAYYKWLKYDPDFAAELEEARNSVLTEAMGKLRQSVNQATDGLIELLNSNNEEIRRKSANDIIGLVLKWKEQDEIENRLVEIESLIFERRTYR